MTWFTFTITLYLSLAAEIPVQRIAFSYPTMELCMERQIHWAAAVFQKKVMLMDTCRGAKQ